MKAMTMRKLPPIERWPDGSPPRLTPEQRIRAGALIRQECCNYDDGNCIALDDGDECVCVQSISYCAEKRTRENKRTWARKKRGYV
jgi:hypothetical protein